MDGSPSRGVGRGRGVILYRLQKSFKKCLTSHQIGVIIKSRNGRGKATRGEGKAQGAHVRPSRQRIPTAWSRAMRYKNVNQAVTNPPPAGTPAVLGKGVAQQDTQRAERLFFLLGGPLWYVSHRNGTSLQPFLHWQFSQIKRQKFVQNFLPEIAFEGLTKPSYRAYNRVNKEMRNTERRK